MAAPKRYFEANVINTKGERLNLKFTNANEFSEFRMRARRMGLNVDAADHPYKLYQDADEALKDAQLWLR